MRRSIHSQENVRSIVPIIPKGKEEGLMVMDVSQQSLFSEQWVRICIRRRTGIKTDRQHAGTPRGENLRIV